MERAGVGVYVHVPFCERVCPYCDFAVVARRRLGEEEEARYLAALLAELALRRQAFPAARLESLYLGGGTPSLLRPASVARLVEAVAGAFAPGDAPEITLEVNPSTLERERLPGFRSAGVNRLSLGIQSFDDATLKRLGRAHRADEAWRTLRAARAAGFDNLSLDLMLGVPGQDLAGVEADAEAAVSCAPEHVSAYGLTVEAGTPYATGVARGVLRPPDDDTAARMLAAVRQRLEAAGLRLYEISSYARPGFEAVHNRRYWRRQPVLGLGLGAWSHDPPTPEAPWGARRRNLPELTAYLERVQAGAPAEAASEVLDRAAAQAEAAFLSLRTRRGLRAAEFEREFGAAPRQLFGPAIDELCQAGLLREEEGGDLALTPQGWLLSDSVFERFV